MNHPSSRSTQPAQPEPVKDDLAGVSLPPAIPPRAVDLQKEIRSFDTATRRDLVRLGAAVTPTLTLKAKMAFPQLAEALRNADTEQRRDFVTPFATSILTEPHLKEYVADKLPFILRHLSVSEKGELIRHLFETRAGRRRDRLMLAAEVFRSSDDFHDFRELCVKVGPQRIRRIGGAQMQNILARYEFIGALRELQIDPDLPTRARIKEAKVRLDDLMETLLAARETVRRDTTLARTPFGQHLLNIIKADIGFLKHERKSCRRAAEFRELANSMSRKMKLEFQYGVAITIRHEGAQKLVQPWTTEELREISSTLKRFPQCLLILSRHLTTIRKDPNSELSTPTESVDGMWDDQLRTIQLREGLHNDQDSRKACGGKSPLGVTLTHEIAHVVESDRGYDLAQAKLEDGRDPPLFYSSEYRKISGWSIVDPAKYRITDGGKSALIDGTSYRIERDVARIGGKDVFLVYDRDYRTLFSHPIRAEWSLDDYSRANPSEDFAVSFAEYFSQPKQLAKFAPSKFMLFERLFGEYGDQAAILDLAARSLKSREQSNGSTAQLTIPARPTGRREQFESFMAERFEQMTGGEQSWVLANLRFQKEDRSDTDQIFGLYRSFKQARPVFRHVQFKQFIEDPGCYAAIGDVMLDVLKPYKAANLALLAARLRGAEIGVLTLRSSRDGNQAHLDAISKFTGYTFKQSNLYFVTDPTLNERIRHLKDGAAMKSQILGDFASGEYRDAAGVIHPLSREYRRVIFYEDEPKNLQAARRKAAEFPDGRLVVIDAHKLNAEGIWRSICDRLLSGSIPKPDSKREIVFFDLDGTMFDVPAKIGIIDQKSGRALRHLTQQEYSQKPGAAWLEEVAAAHPEVQREDITFDFDDFKNPDRIAAQVNHPRHLRRHDSKQIRKENREKRTGRASG